jgi:hypothetical protein
MEILKLEMLIHQNIVEKNNYLQQCITAIMADWTTFESIHNC